MQDMTLEDLLHLRGFCADIARHPPVARAFATLCLLTCLWAIAAKLSDRIHGCRAQSARWARQPLPQTMLMLLLITLSGCLWAAFMGLGMAWLSGRPCAFEPLYCALAYGAAPRFLSWIAYPLRKLSRAAYHAWQVLAVAMLLSCTALTWLSVGLVFGMLWWQSLLTILPMMLMLWIISLSELSEGPESFRVMCRWKRVVGAKTIVYFPPGKSTAEIALLARNCDETLERITTLLEVAPLTYRVPIFLFADRATHCKHVQAGNNPSDGYAHSDCITLVDGDWSRIAPVVAHELCHIVRKERVTEQTIVLLDEGLACYIQQVIVRRSTRPAIILPHSLRVLALDRVFYDWRYADEPEYPPPYKYAHAHALADYLVQRNGLSQYLRLCRECGLNPERDAGERLAQAMKAVYSIELPTFEEEWRATWKGGKTRKSRSDLDLEAG